MLTPVQFDDKETKLLFDKEIFPLKRRTNQKLYTLFEEIKRRLKDTEQHKQFIFPSGTDFTTGKISQGENYGSYPWVILDFPKLFSKENIFAFRSMFLYGHYFSFNLLLSGNSVHDFLPVILRNRAILSGKDFYFSFHEDAWVHILSAEKNRNTDTLTENEWIEHVVQTGYLKLTRLIHSTNPAEISNMAEETYTIFLKLLSGSPDTHH